MVKHFVTLIGLVAVVGVPAKAQEFSQEQAEYYARMLGHITVGADACEHYVDEDSVIALTSAFLNLVQEANGSRVEGAKMLEDSKLETLEYLRRDGRTQWCEIRLPLFMKWAVDEEIANSIFQYGFE